MKTIMIVSDPEIAAYVVAAGVDRVFVDLEWMGKAERQPGDTWKSRSGVEDISIIREAAPGAELMVRVNPMHAGTGAEVEEALARGADVLMLPMFRGAGAVARFAEMVDGRARLMPLVETVGALGAVGEIAALGVEELYFGLNDLHLDMGCSFMFEPLADGQLDAPAAQLRAAGIPFGIGGIAKLGGGAVPAELVLAEHARLGSDWVILSRGFYGRAADVAGLEAEGFAGALAALQAEDQALRRAGAEALGAAHARFRGKVRDFAEQRRRG